MPDDVFAKMGCVMWIEFKLPGKDLTPAQEEEHEAMRQAGLEPKMCWSFDAFKNLMIFADPTMQYLR